MYKYGQNIFFSGLLFGDFFLGGGGIGGYNFKETLTLKKNHAMITPVQFGYISAPLSEKNALVKLKSSLRKLYGRHHDLVDRYGIYVSQMTTDMFHLS